MLDTFPDSDPARALEPLRCVAAVLHGERRRIELPREVGSARRFLRRRSYWDALLEAVAGGTATYREYSYRRRADHYEIRFSPSGAERLRVAALLLRYPALRSQVGQDIILTADLFVER